MIEMLNLLSPLSSVIKNISYLVSSKNLRIGFKNGILRYLRNERNGGLPYYFKDEIEYI